MIEHADKRTRDVVPDPDVVEHALELGPRVAHERLVRNHEDVPPRKKHEPDADDLHCGERSCVFGFVVLSGWVGVWCG